MSKMVRTRFTSRDLEVLPEDTKRYEIIDGELYVSKQPTYAHQAMCGGMFAALDAWSLETDAGVVTFAPGVIFADDDDVAPDLTWVAKARLAALLGPEGHFHAAPDLIVEVLSPGLHNEQRDRQAKLGLYSRRGVREYWIVDWQNRQVQVHRRRDAALTLDGTLLESDTLTSPLLPGFSLPLADLFARLP